METTGKTVEEARDRALEELGVAEDEAEIDVLDEPKAGLFGLIRGEARLRARVRPAEVRPKVDRRRGRRKEAAAGDEESSDGAVETASERQESEEPKAGGGRPAPRGGRSRRGGGTDGDRTNARRSGRARPSDGDQNEGSDGSADAGGQDVDQNGAQDGGADRDPVEPAAVGAAAVAFMEGLVEAFGVDATVELQIDGTALDVRVLGDEVGLLIGPGGRTLLAIQDLARVAAQRRLGDHETRLRIDVAGYRERRREALERFAHTVAEQVIETGRSRSLEPMPSADRKVVHDVLLTIDGVASHSEGDDPERRVVVTPA
ncbi:MAG: RNA-binding cell elongation regulator Jag/EloR [Ilumatobacteraceae bacterium]